MCVALTVRPWSTDLVQIRAMNRSYEALLKDRSIIAAEVLHEYDEKVRDCV